MLEEKKIEQTEQKEPEIMFDFTKTPIQMSVMQEFLSYYKENPKLNLGCGGDIRKGYVNLDIMPINGITVRCDVRGLGFLPPKSAEEILAYDLLEHFPFAQTKSVLREWLSKLKPGGKFIVRVPDMAKIARRLLDEDLPAFEAQRLLFGGQEYPFNFHMAGFTAGTLEGLVLGCGCSEIIQAVNEEDTHNIVVVALK